MNRMKVACTIVIIATFVLIAGGVQSKLAQRLRASAAMSLTRQKEASESFQREAETVGKRLQSGEIDDAGWHREVEVVSDRFKSTSEAAGIAWVDQLQQASRHSTAGSGLIAIGIVLLATGVFLCIQKRRPDSSSSHLQAHY